MQSNIEIKKLVTEKLNDKSLETRIVFSEFERIKMFESINETIRKTKLRPLLIVTNILSAVIGVGTIITCALLPVRFYIIPFLIFTISFLMNTHLIKKVERKIHVIDKSSKETADKIALLLESGISDDKIPVKIEFADIIDNNFTGPRIKVAINDILIPECRLDIQYRSVEWITIFDELDVDTRKNIFYYKIILCLPEEFREKTEKVCIQTNIEKEN